MQVNVQLSIKNLVSQRTKRSFTSRVKVPTMDYCIVYGVLKFSLWVTSLAAIDHRNCIAKSKNSPILMKVKGQRPFFILTQFDHSHSSKYRLFEGASPLMKSTNDTVASAVFIWECMLWSVLDTCIMLCSYCPEQNGLAEEASLYLQ